MNELERSGLAVAVLGPFRAILEGHPLPKLATMRAQALLVYLVVEGALGESSQRREALVELLWPGMPPSSGRKNLRQTLYYLRQAVPNLTRDDGVGLPFIIADRYKIAINPAFPLWLDTADFLRLLDGPQEGWPEAVALYRDDFLTDLYLEDSNDFEAWATARRAYFRRKALDALEKLAIEAANTQDLVKAREYAERRLEIDNLQESAHYQLMEILALSGRREEALAQYKKCRRLLSEELGLEPSAESVALYQRIASGQALAIQPQATRLTGYDAPERLEDEKALPRHNLPQQATPLIGREEEVNELVEWLVNERDRRLVTIVGPGGIGKSRLALETAATLLDHFADGVFFTPLAPLDSASTIVPALADSLGFRFLGTGEPLHQLLEHLSQKQMLLVLDNFEHLLEGTGLVVAILAAAPQIKILATSRQRLRLTAETLFYIGGLSHPSDDSQPSVSNPGRYGAVQLLRHYAGLVRPDLSLGENDLLHASRIARLVQGMPLAIILAASWLEMLSLDEIAVEIANSLDILEGDLRDLPQRQRSVRAVFDSSWRHLSEADREGLMKLAVFRGGFTREAAVAIAGANLRALRTLIDKSLIAVTQSGRYEIHELLRQFAAEKLVQAGLAKEIRDAHGAFYLKALAVREIDLKGNRQVAALDEIEADFENIRAAWNWALQEEQWTHIDLATEALFLYTQMHGRNLEGVELLHTGKDLIAGSSQRLWGRLSARTVMLGIEIDEEGADALQILDKCLAFALEHNDRPETAFILLVFGYFHAIKRKDLRKGSQYFRQSLERFQELDDGFYASRALHRVGFTHDKFDSYIDYHRRSLDLAIAVGNKHDTAMALCNLGSAMIGERKPEVAKEYLDQAITVSTESGDQFTLAHSLVLLGLHHFLQGEGQQAYLLTTRSLNLSRKIGFRLTESYALGLYALFAGSQGNYLEALEWSQKRKSLMTNRYGDLLASWALSITHTGLGHFELAWNEARSAIRLAAQNGWTGPKTWPLAVLGILLAQRDLPFRSVEVLAQAESEPNQIGWLKQWPLLVDTKARLRQQLGKEAFDLAWKKGQAQDLEQLVDQLLSEEMDL